MANLIQRGIGCLQEHGIRFTARRFFELAKNKISRPSREQNVNGMDEDSYLAFLEKENYYLRNNSKNPDFINIREDDYLRQRNDVKLLAWYLPQYYRMDVNDRYHGAGFTEWTNTTRTIPMYAGHRQPRLPYDVGFYNLTMLETLKRQVKLANKYGIYGFCIDYYWFSGIKTMEKPLELLHKNTDLDIRYMVNWCTENWTALWDGENKNLIFEQKLSDGDDRKFFDDLLPYLKDERYVKIDGKPAVMIYKCTLFEKERFKLFLQNIRDYAKQAGFPDLYVMLTTADFSGDVKEWGADALAEYPTMNLKDSPKYDVHGHVNPNFKGSNNIYDYRGMIEKKTFEKTYGSDVVFYSAMTNFDNSARKAFSENCLITQDSTPDIYGKWLKNVIDKTSLKTRDERYAFILSWNEWAEAAHLEPDMTYGYGYLDSTRRSLEESRILDQDLILDEYEKKKKNGPVHFYIHCIESLGDVVACEPIPRFLKSLGKDDVVTWIVKKNNYRVIQFNPHIDEIIQVDYLTQSIELIEEFCKSEQNIIVDCHQNGRRCVVTDRVHRNGANPQINEYTYMNYGPLLSNFCLSAGMPPLKDGPIFYLGNDHDVPELPEKYVVIHCKSAETCKDWDNNKWKKLTQKVIGEGYAVVEIGLEPIVSLSDNMYYDLTDNHDIQSIADVIRGAKAFIGIDSAFAHIANCFNISGVLIFGKYKYFKRPIMYTGNYADGKNVQILYAEGDKPASETSVDIVFEAVLIHLEDKKSA